MLVKQPQDLRNVAQFPSYPSKERFEWPFQSCLEIRIVVIVEQLSSAKAPQVILYLTPVVICKIDS